MPPRPPMLTICAVIGIILGALGVFCQPVQSIQLLATGGVIEPITGFSFPGMPTESITLPPVVYYGMIFSRFITFLYSVLLLISSIGALSLKPWAPKGLMAYAIMSILNNLFFDMLSVIMSRQMMESSGHQLAGAPPVIMFISFLCAGLCYFLVSIPYPVYVLITISRQRVKQAFALGYDPGLYAPPAAYTQPWQQPYGSQQLPPYGAPPPQQGGYTGPYYAQQDYYQPQEPAPGDPQDPRPPAQS